MIGESPMRMIMSAVTYIAVMGIMMAVSHHARADELCPDITKGESALTVSDMAGLQFDIGRLNLCVQRARLLQQIDEIVKKREQIRMEPLAAPSLGGALSGVIPPMAAPMPPLPSDKAVARAVKDNNDPEPAMIAIPQGDWKIQRIWGQGQVMQAQLVKGDVIANVKRGDTLPGGDKVVELSGKGVVLENKKGQHILSWLEDQKAQ